MSGNKIATNAICKNGYVGIDLVDSIEGDFGPTPNDSRTWTTDPTDGRTTLSSHL